MVEITKQDSRFDWEARKSLTPENIKIFRDMLASSYKDSEAKATLLDSEFEESMKQKTDDPKKTSDLVRDQIKIVHQTTYQRGLMDAFRQADQLLQCCLLLPDEYPKESSPL